MRATEDCQGAAHSNPWIDNCAICAPFWGKVLPEQKEETMHVYGIDGHDWRVSLSSVGRSAVYLVTQGDSVWHMEEDSGALPMVIREPDDVDEWATRCAQEAVIRFIAEG